MNKNTPKNIIFITKGSLPFPPVKGGAVENLLQIIVEKNEAYCDYKFSVFSIFDHSLENYNFEKYKKCSFKYINPFSYNYKVRRFFRYIINRNKHKYFGNQFITEVINRTKNENLELDAIILENAPEYAIPLRKVTNKPIIQHLHNELLYKGSRHDKKISKSSDLFISVSNYITNRVSTTVEDTSKLKTLYNGIDLISFNKKLPKQRYDELRNKYGINDNEIVIVFTGRLQPHKGVKELFLAFNRIAHIYNVKLLVIGASGYSTTKKSEYIKELEQISSSCNNQVIFTGYVDYNTISDYYKIGNIGVLPSLWEDPCPLSCIESLASGLPLITTNSGGIPELVNDDSAFIIDKNKDVVSQIEEKLILLIENKELRESMGRAARLRSQLFSDEKFYQNFKQLINENI